MSLFSLLQQLFRNRSRKATRSARRNRRIWDGHPMILEALEDRTVPDAVVWNVATGGNWNVASNWLDTTTGLAQVPTAADDVTINQSNITITVSDAEAANSLHTALTNDLVIPSGGSLVIATDSELDGALTLSGGSLTNDGPLTLDGDTQWSAGTIDGTGSLTNSGTLTVSGGSSLSLGENLTNDGTLTIGPATMLDVDGDFTQGSNGLLDVQLGGPPASGQFGQLTVDAGNSATLNGTFQAQLVDGYVPAVGDDFTVVTYSTNSNTTFAHVVLPVSDGVTIVDQIDNTFITLDSDTAPSITMQPSDDTVTSGQTASFTAEASGTPAPTVQWEVSTNDGASFSDVSGATSDTLTFTATYSQNGDVYEAVFTNDAGSATTNPVTLTVMPLAPSITMQPSDDTVTSGQSASFTAEASGDPSPTVQWQVSTDGGSTFTDVSGATSDTLTFTTTYSQNGDIYEAVFTNIGGTITSNPATLTVSGLAPSITMQPSDDTVASGQIASFTAEASGDPNPTVQWQVSTDGGVTFSNVSGATSDTLSFTATYSQNGDIYEAVFTNIAGGATTNPVTLTVSALAPSITMQPSNETVASGQTVSFAAAASGDPNPTVQWEVSTDGGTTFTDVSGATSDTLSFTADSSQNGNLYEAVFTNIAGSATTNPAMLTVTADVAPSIIMQPSDDTVASGQTASFTAAASGNPNPTVQWEVSTDSGTTFSDVSGATSDTLSFTATYSQNGDIYEAVFTNLAGSATSNPATLTVTALAPSITMQPSNDTVTSGQSASFTATASGDPNPTVQWQVSTDGGVSFMDVSGATSDTLSFTAAYSQNGDFYRAVFTNIGGGATSNPALLTVSGLAPSITMQPSNETVTSGQTASFTAAASGDPNPTVQWEVSTDGGSTFTDVSGATSDTLSFTTAYSQNGDIYEAVFANIAGSATTNPVTLTVSGLAPSITMQPSDDTVASGQIASFTATASGDPNPTVQWQVSTNGGTSFSDVSGATSDTLSFTAAYSQNGNIYEAVFTNVAGSVTSNPVTLTVSALAPSITMQPSNESVTAGQSVSFTAAASGDPSPTVQWQVSTDGGTTFSDVGGATSDTLSFAAAYVQNGDIYEAVFTNIAGSATTNPVTLTVSALAPSVTMQPSNETVTSGQSVSFTAAANGDPNPTVQWQVSTNGGTTFSDVSGATSDTLSFTAAYSQNGDIYEAVFTNIAGSATSNPATLTVSGLAPSITTQPSNDTVTSGQSASFTAAASGDPNPTVQWEVSTDGGTTFTDVGGATSDTLSFTTTYSQNGDIYEAVFTNIAGSATSSPVTLTVSGLAPSITMQPSNETVNSGQSASFTAAASGDPSPTVQWQVSTDGGSTFSDVSGATSDTLSFTASYAQNGNIYEAVFTNIAGGVTTSPVTLTVSALAPSITMQPSNDSVTSGQTASFTATASGDPNPTVQWQVSTDGGATFSNVSGATTDTLSFTAAYAQNGDIYEAVFTNIAGSVTSNPVTLTVSALAPSITMQPSNDTVTSGQTASFTATASGDPAPTVQWQVSTDGGTTFSNVSGATSDTLTFTAAYAQNGNIYEAVFTNIGGSATSNPVTLTVSALAPSITMQPSNDAVASGQSASFTAKASGDPNPTVQWQVSTDGGATFSNVNGATSDTLTFTADLSQNGDIYEAVFTNIAGSATSNPVTLTVTLEVAPSITMQPSNDTVTSGQTASFTAAASGNPNPTVQWQVSTDGGATFSNVSGATSDTLMFTAAYSQNGNIYEAVFTNIAGSVTSSPVTLTVNPLAPSITMQPSNDTVTSGQTASFTATASGDPTPTVQWQVSTDGGVSFTKVSGATLDTLSLTAAYSQNGDIYEAVFTNIAGSVTSNPVTLTVSGLAPSIIMQPSNDTVTSGQTASFTAVASGDPNPSVQWEVSTNGGATFSDVSGATSDTLTFSAAYSQNGDLYRAVFTNIGGSATSNTVNLTVTAITPHVTTQPVSLIEAVGQTATFTAAASGTPSPTVQWQVSTDGGATFSNISGATSDTLSFTVTAAANGREYQAVFTNVAGTATTSAVTLTVITPSTPAFTSVNHDTLLAGMAGSFTIATNASPTAALSEVGGLPAGLMFVDNGNGTATLGGTPTTGTGGVYHLTLLAFNGISTTQTFTLTIDQAPAVVTQPTNQTVTAGQQATFTAAASAYPAAKVQWQVKANGSTTFKNIAGATSTTLHVASSLATNGNQYQAVFTNSVGSMTTAAATLTVYKAPAITSVNHFTFKVGTAGSFTVSATGSPTAALSEAGTLPAGLTFVDNGNGTATLGGTPTAGTGGTYQLVIVASNALGGATQTFTLTINQAPAITTSPSDQTVTAGQKVTFTAAASANPAAKVQWQVMTQGSTTFKNIGGATSTTLTVTASAALNGAEYRAVFTNSLGSIPTNVATLTVDSAPTITSVNHATFSVGTADSFTIVTTGFPAATLNIIGGLPGDLVVTDNHNGTFTLSGMPDTEDSGTYHLVLVASNSIDSAIQTFTLTIK